MACRAKCWSRSFAQPARRPGIHGQLSIKLRLAAWQRLGAGQREFCRAPAMEQERGLRSDDCAFRNPAFPRSLNRRTAAGLLAGRRRAHRSAAQVHASNNDFTFTFTVKLHATLAYTRKPNIELIRGGPPPVRRNLFEGITIQPIEIA